VKWAHTADGKMAAPTKPPHKGEALESSKNKDLFEQSGSEVPPCGGFRGASRLLISNEFSNRLVHKWRSEESAILVGTNTAFLDDPELTNRLWSGHSPVRLVLDMNLRLPSSLKIFDKQQPAIVFNKIKQEENKNLLYYQLKEDGNIIQQIVTALYQLKIQSVLVEGGARLLQSFIDAGLWDEARVITNTQLTVADGLAAPGLPKKIKVREEKLLYDLIETFKPLIH
jgi:diaminohydroxyphosphoribosylaminopyrimidine deaminase/5-amino-6-(5-phosphoribosylamino)uracil reductase